MLAFFLVIMLTGCKNGADMEHTGDADGFLWGTEGYVNTVDAVYLPAEATVSRDAINNTLKTTYVKFRISRAFFTTTDGSIFSNTYCMPNPSQCDSLYDMDEVAKVFRDNGWSMIPMLRTDETQTITTDVIDDYVNFVDWFVGRYGEAADIQMIELVNSPAADSDTWKGSSEQLVDLVNKTYDRVKSNYPDVAVGTPGFEYWVDDNTGCNGAYISIVDFFLDKNNGAKFDFWAFHGYAMSGNAGGAMVGPYPPTMTPLLNKYANVTGILKIRDALDANGWQDRKIIDTEHSNITDPGQPITSDSDALDAAYVIQELTLKRTLMKGADRVLSAAVPLKMEPRSTTGEAALGSLTAEGSVTLHVRAMALLWSQLKKYNYAGHVSGAFDDESQAWVEKFTSGKTDFYIFFKPFKYVSGQKISLDGQTLDYTLNLAAVPSSIVLTTIDGSKSTVIPAQSLTLAAENTPKFLEVTYP